MPPGEVADGVWVLPLRTPTLPPGTATNTMVVAGDRVAIVEPATPYADERARLDALLDALLDRGKAPAAIIVTHHHVDHVGYAPGLRERTGAPILAHAETAARVDFAVDGHLEDGDVVDLGGRALHVAHTPGHAPGHVCVVEPDVPIMHAGDLVAGEGTILIDPRDDGDLATYLASLRETAEAIRTRWPGCRLVPAHGPIQDEPVALLEHYVRHRLGREAKLLAALAGGRWMDDAAVLRATYDDVPEAVLAIARWSLEAHLGKLVDEGRVDRRDGSVRRVDG